MLLTSQRIYPAKVSSLSTLYLPGQRWYSLTEPELGLGIIVRVEGRDVVVSFPAREVVRQYEAAEAPLARAHLSRGQTARGAGVSFVVDDVRESGGVLTYCGGGHELPEPQLDAEVDVATPENRMRTGVTDGPADFELRREALGILNRMLRSPARGFFGGRIRLFEHQLSIAHQVCERHRVRVLLADEVGLGKTIEALLILHRLLLSGRVERALVIVPPALVHQWLAEAYLRFHMILRVIGRDTVGGEDLVGPDAPSTWGDAQMFVCPLDYEGRADLEQGDWDIVIIDEAHHLEPDSEAFAAISDLVVRVPHAVMLSATPDRDGELAHFRRLALLEPERFSDPEAYRNEAAHYQPLANVAERLKKGEDLAVEDLELLRERLGDFDPGELHSDQGRRGLLRRLLDLHGLGRVMFRNVRARIPGFPVRRVLPAELFTGDPAKLRREFLSDVGHDDGYQLRSVKDDPRLAWLRDFLNVHEDERVLVLCTSRAKVEAFSKALESSRPDVARFHEGMSSVERDRQAAWFLDKDGPQVLISSAIGAEGRNFQVARNLVLLDLPLSADRLEQLIGRIDRIGQGDEVRVFVPTLPGTPQARLKRWFDEALDVFRRSWHGSPAIDREFGAELFKALLAENEGPIENLIQGGRARNTQILGELESGRDRLLELTSFDPEAVGELNEHIELAEEGPELESFMIDSFERAGLDVEDIGPRSYAVRVGPDVHRPFPGFVGDEMAFTFDRQLGLKHPERILMTWDHPMLQDILDDQLSNETGNAAVAHAIGDRPGLLLRAIYIVEPTLPASARADRFLPATPVEVFVDAAGHEFVPAGPLDLRPTSVPIQDNPQVVERLLMLIDRARALAEARAPEIAEGARKCMRAELGPTVERLRELTAIQRPASNAAAAPNAECKAAETELDYLDLGLQQVRTRLDALCLVLVTAPQ